MKRTSAMRMGNGVSRKSSNIVIIFVFVVVLGPFFMEKLRSDIIEDPIRDCVCGMI
jgi:hypothetical protein